jgi:hypothetical protein
MSKIDAAAVIKSLERMPVSVETAMLPPPQGVPNTGGFYAWWVRRGSLPTEPERPHPTDPSSLLLYVGISPARASSSQTIRGRVIGNHINGNTGSSTFRFVLASFLIHDLDLHPTRSGTKVVLSASENERLRAWQHEHLRLTWCGRERPWEIEQRVIEAMKPPLNAAGNSSHPFYSTVKTNRAAFRAAATDATQATERRPTAARRAAPRRPRGASATTATNVSEFLQNELRRRGTPEVTAVEAAQWLAQAGVLADSDHRPGLPLRNLLRAGSIAGAEQRPTQPHGRWVIKRMTNT